MTANQLFEQIRSKRSFLCVGLDSDMARIPEFLLTKPDPIFEFNRMIVDATAPYAVAYKPNFAFYEAHGAKGWDSLQRTVKYIRTTYPTIFTIADAKRGDIANTARMYAKAFFSSLGFDAATVSPYMGQDSVDPFLSFPDKWAIVLALTSNPSYSNFQLNKDSQTGNRLFEDVIVNSMHWGTEENMMYVVGATRAQMLADIRKLAPDHFLLVPGVGEQGGSLADVARYGMNRRCGLLVNSSRGIIYADRTMNFAEAAKSAAIALQKQMGELLDEAGLL